jgi:hypothetical protein
LQQVKTKQTLVVAKCRIANTRVQEATVQVAGTANETAAAAAAVVVSMVKNMTDDKRSASLEASALKSSN